MYDRQDFMLAVAVDYGPFDGAAFGVVWRGVPVEDAGVAYVGDGELAACLEVLIRTRPGRDRRERAFLSIR